jgi:hypothetical protein
MVEEYKVGLTMSDNRETTKEEIIRIVNETDNEKYLYFIYCLLNSFRKKMGAVIFKKRSFKLYHA